MDRPMLPDVYFGSVNSEPMNWRKAPPDQSPDDDSRLVNTPADVIAMLGFDPNDFYNGTKRSDIDRKLAALAARRDPDGIEKKRTK